MTSLATPARILAGLGTLVFAAGAVLCLVFLTDAAEDYAREPEHWWSLVILAVLAALFTSLNLANAAFTYGKDWKRALLIAANLVGIIGCLAVLVIGQSDPATVLIALVALVGPASTMVALAASA